MVLQILRRGADDQLEREQSPRDQSRAGTLRAVAKADVDAIEHPISDLVVELDLGLDGGVLLAELVQHRRQYRRKTGLRPHDAYRAGDCLASFLHLRERAVQRSERGNGLLQQMSAFLGGREATGRAMQEPYAQVTLELGDGVARRLRRDSLGERRLADAAELDRLGEGRDGAQFVEGHGVASINPGLLLVQPFMD